MVGYRTLKELMKESQDAEEYLKKETLEVISEIVEDFDVSEDKVRMPPPKSDHFCEIVGLGLKGTIQVGIESSLFSL